jgi:medium-chain acyl-[acyl-carrier-protein] hydrolase
MTSNGSLWFPGIERYNSANVRLFCFPHAGGGTVPFVNWRAQVPPEIAICPVRLPGRESRLGEPPFTDTSELVQVLATAIQPWLDRPYAFFGHSLGALVSFELARELSRSSLPLPVHLFLSGHSAPETPEVVSAIRHLDDTAFIAELRRRYGRFPVALEEHSELLELILPYLRADVTLFETHVYQPGPPLARPITAFGGEADDTVPRAHLEQWSAYTSAPFHLRMFPGDHFYVESAYQDIARHIASKLQMI